MATQRSLQLDPYDIILDRVKECLEDDLPPWQLPWSKDSPVTSMPLRHNGIPYQGINVISLLTAAHAKGYEYPYWMTYQQAKKHGGFVRKGERGTKIRIYLTTEEEDEATAEETTKTAGGKNTIPAWGGQWWTVFNVHQIDGLPEHFYTIPKFMKEFGPQKDPKLEQFFAATGAIIEPHASRAMYSVTHDKIEMPPVARFEDAGQFYATLAHEVIHWTGHKDRCNRQMGRSGTTGYAKEEVIAEFGNCMLCYQLGLQPDYEQSSSFIKGWLERLAENKDILKQVAAAGTKASQHVIGYAPSLVKKIAAENALVGTLPKSTRAKLRPPKAAAKD